MTVIAWDGKILAADKQGTWSNLIRSCTKIFKLDDGRIAAFCGSVGACHELLEWVKKGCHKKDYPQDLQDSEQWANIIIVENGQIKFSDRRPYFIPIEDSIAAWGVGADFAIGAMEAGANAIRAIKIASKWSEGCGNGIDFFEVIR